MYLFQISNYDALLWTEKPQNCCTSVWKLRAGGAVPAMWNAIDRIRNSRRERPGARKGIWCTALYGVFLLALSFDVDSGLMPPKPPMRVIAGAAAIIAVLAEFALVRRKNAAAHTCILQKGGAESAGAAAGR